MSYCISGMNPAHSNSDMTLKERIFKLIFTKKIAYNPRLIPQELHEELSTYNEAHSILGNNNNDYSKSIIYAVSTPSANANCLKLLFDKSSINPNEIGLRNSNKYNSVSYNGVYPISLVTLAAAANNPDVIRLLCSDKYQVSANEQEFNSKVMIITPLMWASEGGNTEAIKSLVSCGADVNLSGACENTPLHVAKNPETIATLIKHGADINALRAGNWTPLMAYIKQRSIDKTKKILEFPGHNFAATNYSGKNALELANASGNPEIITLVKQAIAEQKRAPRVIVSKRPLSENPKQGFKFLP